MKAIPIYENPFINMYQHMDILVSEPNGNDDKDAYDEDDLNLHDVSHPDYMPPHVQDRLLGPRIPREIRNLQTFNNPNPGTPKEQDDNELLEEAAYTKHVPKRRWFAFRKLHFLQPCLIVIQNQNLSMRLNKLRILQTGGQL
jgi:hypothetical protein